MPLKLVYNENNIFFNEQNLKRSEKLKKSLQFSYNCSVQPGNTRGGSITVRLTSCLTGLDQSVLQIKTKIVICHTAYLKPVKQEVNGTVILPPLVFPSSAFQSFHI
jgi:hypothetical protein